MRRIDVILQKINYFFGGGNLMKKIRRILPITLILIFLLTGTSFAAGGPVNSYGTTLYDFGDGYVSSMTGTSTWYNVDSVESRNSLFQGSTRMDLTIAKTYNNYYADAWSKSIPKLSGYQYQGYGYHIVIYKGVQYTMTSQSEIR